MADPELSICLVTYKVKDLLRDCLNSLQANPPCLPYEVIITDNNSQDGTLEMLAKDYPAVRVIANSENRGYTAPMNQALRAGTGRYLMQLNPDTLILPGLFQALVEFMESHPQAGICTPKVLNRDGTLQMQCRRSAARPWDALTYLTGLSRLFPNDPRFGGYLMSYKGEDETHLVEAVSGSCMLIRREVVEQIGYLDEAMFAYQEDTDFCFRARQAGWEIYFLPTARIIHFGGEGGSKVDLPRSVIEWHRSYYLYYRKNLARDYFFLLNWLFYLLIGVKFAVAYLSIPFRQKKYVGSPKP